MHKALAANQIRRRLVLYSKRGGVVRLMVVERARRFLKRYSYTSWEHLDLILSLAYL